MLTYRVIIQYAFIPCLAMVPQSRSMSNQRSNEVLRLAYHSHHKSRGLQLIWNSAIWAPASFLVHTSQVGAIPLPIVLRIIRLGPRPLIPHLRQNLFLFGRPSQLYPEVNPFSTFLLLQNGPEIRTSKCWSAFSNQF